MFYFVPNLASYTSVCVEKSPFTISLDKLGVPLYKWCHVDHDFLAAKEGKPERPNAASCFNF